MPYRRLPSSTLFTPAVLRLAAFALLLTAITLTQRSRLVADPLPRDPVADFRQALLQEKDTIKDKESLKFRSNNLTRKAKALTSPGEMGRVLLLQEWKVEAFGEPVADIDREVRDSIAERFIKTLKEDLVNGDSIQRMAATVLIGEMASNTHKPGFKVGFLRPLLASLTPDLIKLTTDPDLRVQQFAAESLGNIQGDPKSAVKTLETLINTGGPGVRRSAANALGNLVQVLAEQEKRVRGGDVGRVDLRKELLTVGILVAPAAATGLVPNQSVEVRRLSADAWQQVTTAVVDLTLDPFPLERFPPPGRPWSADEAKRIEEDRDAVAQEREELRPLLEAFDKQGSALLAASSDPDPYVRIQTRRVLEDLAIIRLRLNRREASVPRGESVPPPKPEPNPEDTNGRLKPGGVFLSPAPSIGGVAILPVVNQVEKQKVEPEKSKSAAVLELKDSLRAGVEGLSDPNLRARIAAVEVLETMGTDAAPAIPVLVAHLNDPDRFVRWGILRTLGRLAPRMSDQVVPAVACLLNDNDLDVSVAAANTLERFGVEARAAVVALALRVNRGDAEIRIAAMKALQAIGTDAAPALPAVAQNFIPKTRAEIEHTPGPEGDPLPPARVRVAAAETLGRFGKLAEQGVPILRRALYDIDADVRQAAGEAILKITGVK